MKEYTVLYREKYKPHGIVFETSITADNLKQAKQYSKTDPDMDYGKYTILSVKLASWIYFQ